MALKDFVKTEYTPAQQIANRDKEMRDAYMEEAGLEGVDANYLRTHLLSAAEAVQAKTEQMNQIRARKSRKKDWDEYTDAKRRWGRALHSSEFILRLRRQIPGLCVVDGVMRRKDGSIDLGLYKWDRTHPFQDKVGGTVYLDYIHCGWNPEYEIDICNEAGVAIRKMHGWRTVLLSLICRRDPITCVPKSILTESQALEEFGLPTNGDTASNYRQQLYDFRNTSAERVKMNAEILQKAAQYNFA